MSDQAGQSTSDKLGSRGSVKPKKTAVNRVNAVLIVQLLFATLAVIVSLVAVHGAARAPVISAFVVMALAAFAAGVADDVASKLALLALAAVFGTGLVLAEVERTAIAGFAVIMVAVTLLPIIAYVCQVHGRALWSKTLLVRLAVGLSMAATVLGLVGFLEANQAAFALRYGTQVVVYVPDTCTQTLTTDYRAGTSSGSTDCEKALWTVNGVDVTGTLHAGYAELGDILHGLTTTQIRACAWGNNAYTPSASGGADWFTPLGFVSGWLFFAGPFAIIVALLRGLRRRARARQVGGEFVAA